MLQLMVVIFANLQVDMYDVRCVELQYCCTAVLLKDRAPSDF